MNTIKGSQTKYWLPFIVYIISNLIFKRRVKQSIPRLATLSCFQASGKLVHWTNLLPLNCCWWFACDIVDDAVDVVDFVYDAD